MSYYTDPGGYWIIEDGLTFSVLGNSGSIKGIVTNHIPDTCRVNFKERLSSKDENGTTQSVVGYANSNIIRNGEKTYFEVKIDNALPLMGTNIDVTFNF